MKDFTFYRRIGEYAGLCRELARRESGPGRKRGSDTDGDFARDFVLKVRVREPAESCPAPAGSEAADAPPPTEPSVTAASAVPPEAPSATAARETERVGRAIACKCFNGQYISVTVREFTGQPTRAAVTWPRDTVALAAPAPISTTLQINEWQENRLIIDELWRCLGRELVKGGDALTGLVVLAGRTGSRKSSLAAAFTRRYLQHRISQGGKRRPHLVTFEDPIEERFDIDPPLQPAKAKVPIGDRVDADPEPGARDLGFDYTPRQKGTDAAGLADSLRDALRQTPAVVYVGETRDEGDWKALLHFAGTGHLVVTTAHAGSLTETMAQIVHATEVKTPAQRSRIGSRIVALVHLRPETVSNDTAVIPSAWFRSPQAVSAFIAEGIGSMQPSGFTRERAAREPPSGSYGRAYFVGALHPSKAPLRKKALRWDLRGD